MRDGIVLPHMIVSLTTATRPPIFDQERRCLNISLGQVFNTARDTNLLTRTGYNSYYSIYFIKVIEETTRFYMLYFGSELQFTATTRSKKGRS